MVGFIKLPNFENYVICGLISFASIFQKMTLFFVITFKISSIYFIDWMFGSYKLTKNIFNLN